MKIKEFENMLPFTIVKVSINKNLYLLVQTEWFLWLRTIDQKMYISWVITYICGVSNTQKVHIKKIIKANNLKNEKIEKNLLEYINKYFYKQDPLLKNNYNLYFELETIKIIYDPYKQIEKYEKMFTVIWEEYFEDIYSDYIKLFLSKWIKKEDIWFYEAKATNLQKTSSKDYDFLIKWLNNFKKIKWCALENKNILFTNKFWNLIFDLAKFNRDHIGKITTGIGYCDIKVVPSPNEYCLTNYIIKNSIYTWENIILVGTIKYDDEVLCSPGSFTIIDEKENIEYKVLFMVYEYCWSLWEWKRWIVYWSLATSKKGDQIIIVHDSDHFIVWL